MKKAFVPIGTFATNDRGYFGRSAVAPGQLRHVIN